MWPHWHWRGPARSRRDPGWGHLDSWPQWTDSSQYLHTYAQWGFPNSQPHQPSILLETRSLTPALQGALWHRLRCTLAALHTLLTGSLLSPHPTSRPPEGQTSLVGPVIPDTLGPSSHVHTQTHTPAKEASNTGMSARGGVQSKMWPDLGVPDAQGHPQMAGQGCRLLPSSSCPQQGGVLGVSLLSPPSAHNVNTRF